MQTIVLKYIQLFCVAVFFDNVNCDQMELRNTTQDDLSRTVGCTVHCLKEEPLMTLRGCYQNCESKIHEKQIPIADKPSTHKLKLVCRDDTSLVFEVFNILDVNKTNYESKKQAHISHIIENYNTTDILPSRNVYIFKLQDGENILSQNIVYISDIPFVIVKNLTANTTYNVFATVLNDVEYSPVENYNSFSIKTLETFFNPGNVTNIEFGNFLLDNETTLLNVDVSWYPAKDMACSYIYYIHPKSNSLINKDMEQEEIFEPDHFFRHTITNLTFGAEYEIGFSAYNKRFRQHQSHIIWRTLSTPTCLEWYNNSLDFCAPLKPENINAEPFFVEKNLYNFNVTWNTPELKPNYYVIQIIITNYILVSQMNVSGDVTYVFMENVNMSDAAYYDVKVIAFSVGGNSSNTFEFGFENLYYKYTEKYQELKVLLCIGIPIFVTVFATIISTICYNRREKIKRIRLRVKYFEELEEKAPVDPNANFTLKENHLINFTQFKTIQDDFDCIICNDELEIAKENVKILNDIGEGAFGYVRRAILMPSGLEVAVKMLKDSPTLKEIKGFYKEIEVMKSVDRHPNIVGIVGHYTKNMFEMMLLTEFCNEGNLLNYLRNIWHQFNRSIYSTTRNRDSIASTWSKLKLPENDFNFETSLIEKNSQKYKNIIDNSSGDSDYYIIDENSENGVATSSNSDSTVDSTTIIVNKLYDATCNMRDTQLKSGNCNNFCKCKVEIIANNIDMKRNTINIKDCECGLNNQINLTNGKQVKLPFLVENMAYDEENLKNNVALKKVEEENNKHNLNKHSQISSKDLISFAYQVADGMTFLSHNKVVHRDLAARNVLVCSNKTVKIADFGLSRDVYQNNMYKKAGDGKLPIKWLALESMTHQVYTSQSDVWSYGILLYEIVTLGSSPYPSIKTRKLLGILKSGYRMERPSNCDPALYALMLACWHNAPNERPTFSDITKKLTKFLENTNCNELIKLKFNDEEHERLINTASSVSSTESYLKPL